MRGRVKETIVLLGGENVEPVPIENKLLEEELVNQIMIVTDKKTLSALIWPDKDALAKSETLKDGEDLKEARFRNLYVPLIKEKLAQRMDLSHLKDQQTSAFYQKKWKLVMFTSTLKCSNIIADKYKASSRNVLLQNYESALNKG